MAAGPRSGATRRPLVILAGTAPVLVAALLALYRPDPIVRMDHAAYDGLLRAIPARPQSGRVVIVDVDERSLTAVGQWPWRRDVVGDLIGRLQGAGASAIALDIIFPEPDRSTLPSGAAGTPDDALARVLSQGRVILGYAATFDAPPLARRVCVLHGINLPTIQSEMQSNESLFFHATDAVCSLPILSQAASASGFLNAVPDTDGILRRVPVFIELGGHVYPSLAFAAYTMATGTHELTLRGVNVNRSVLTIDDRTLPLDGRSNVLVRYRGRKNTIRYVSAADVMSGTLPAGTLRDKVVFVGTTALGTREVVSTPLDTRFAGVEVQATVADNLLQGDVLSRSPVATTTEALGTLLLGIVVIVLVGWFGLTPGVIAGLAGVTLFWALAYFRLSGSGVYISPITPTLSTTGALALMTLVKVGIERQRADRAGRDHVNAQRLMVQTLLSLTETRDLETGRHSRRTKRYSRLLATRLSNHPAYRDYLTPERIELLSSLAPLHDIGKVGVPDHILNKPGALTPEEFVEMRKHPTLGRDVIVKAEQQSGVRDDVTLAMAKDIVYTHHERWDGTGYPQGLHGTDIPIPGRIMAVVDVFDAVSTRTLYRPPMKHDEVVTFITRGSGLHFDPAVAEAFLSVADEFYAIACEEAAEPAA